MSDSLPPPPPPPPEYLTTIYEEIKSNEIKMTTARLDKSATSE